MEQADYLFLRFGVALAIGFLVGLEREYAQGSREEKLFAGIRTFPLIALTGCAAALASAIAESIWPLVVAFLGMSGLVTMAYYGNLTLGRLGLTTEVAALLTFFIGALVYWDFLALAVALGVATTFLLSVKVEMQKFVRNITREDVFATLKFAVISAIILPVLPNIDYGPAPLDVLNPYRIWLMVVFISGISFFGYVLIKIIGPRQGIVLSGFLGGLVSSTAVTLSFAQRSQTEPELARPLALAITISWTTMFFRVIVVVAALNMTLLSFLWLPMAASAAVGLIYCGYLYRLQPTDEKADVVFANPFELGPALKFGVLYALILVFSQATQAYLGDIGVYFSSITAGLADLNAITLTVADLSRPAGRLDPIIAARALVLAATANTAVKGGIVLALGSQPIRRSLWPGLLLMSITGIVVVFLIT